MRTDLTRPSDESRTIRIPPIRRPWGSKHERLNLFTDEPLTQPSAQGWTWPEGVPAGADLIDPKEPVPSGTRPQGMRDWRPVRRALGRAVTVAWGRPYWTLRLYLARWERRLADGGDRCRRNSWVTA